MQNFIKSYSTAVKWAKSIMPVIAIMLLASIFIFGKEDALRSGTISIDADTINLTLASNKTAITGIINLAHFIALEYDLIKFCINYEKKYHLLTNLQGQVLRALVEN